MVKQISDLDWELASAVMSPAGRRWMRRIRAAATTSTRRETDDDRLLMQIGTAIQADPSLKLSTAVRDVVATLPTNGTTGNGDTTVKVAEHRQLSRSGLEKHLEQKFRKHRASITRRTSSAEWARRLAQSFLEPALAALGRPLTLRLPKANGLAARKVAKACETSASVRDSVSLLEAADAIREEVRKRLRPASHLPEAADAIREEIRKRLRPASR